MPRQNDLSFARWKFSFGGITDRISEFQNDPLLLLPNRLKSLLPQMHVLLQEIRSPTHFLLCFSLDFLSPAALMLWIWRDVARASRGPNYTSHSSYNTYYFPQRMMEKTHKHQGGLEETRILCEGQFCAKVEDLPPTQASFLTSLLWSLFLPYLKSVYACMCVCVHLFH